MPFKPIRVLLVDDSAIIRGLITQALEAHGATEIVGRANNGQMAIEMAGQLKPDVVVLDIEMPVMDGLTALPLILEASPSSKIIMASTLTARNAKTSLQALSLGASDYVAKPSSKDGDEVKTFYVELISKIMALSGRPGTATASLVSAVASAPAGKPTAAVVHKAATPAAVKPISPGEKLNPLGIEALAIASSTGGPQALINLFKELKGQLRSIPIFITQHMPPTFTTILAQQLATSSGMPIAEAVNGQAVQPGHGYLAPGNYHMEVQLDNKTPTISLNQNPPENFCRPAADPMLRSLSRIYGSKLCCVVLTGMGQDGLEGAKDVVNHGGSVVGQDEKSCVVYGMPKAVADAGICKAIVSLPEMSSFLINQIGRRV